MILLVDNYDSFTYNLAHLIGGLGGSLDVVRNDAFDVETVLARFDAIVLSPGPGAPRSAGKCLELVKAAGEKGTPVFGVCLGLQTIAEAFGGRIVRARKLMHGKTCAVAHNGGRLFAGVPERFIATRYHSLIAEPASLPSPPLVVTARSDGDNEIMALEHAAMPIAGVQFHPESIASEAGATILRNFMAWADEFRMAPGSSPASTPGPSRTSAPA
ncbi:MAG: aminodeoxychorismate/anthranilate synthase component II [Alphaproteobacteria bacterium]|nr:aminodeoxychorismate/anthranilate synthase component II [Alphaproteobacteria bacterium]